MKKKEVKIVLIPGNGGATMQHHWFPYVIHAFQDKGITVIARNFPDPYLARRKYWTPFLENELRVDEKTVLIGHSSGAEAAMRYAEDHTIFGSALISPCYTDMGERTETISGWYDGKWEWEKIKKNQQFILQFSSHDDPIVPFSEQEYVQEKLQPEYHGFSDRGHFIGQNEFPELVEAVMKHISA